VSPIPLAELLQVTTANSTTTMTAIVSGPNPAPVWFVAVEVVGTLVGFLVIGTLLTRLITTISLKAGASKRVANSVRQWIWVLMVIGAVTVVAYQTGISSEVTTLTISGIAGLTLSLALQTTISNVISGVLLLNEGVIRLGDDIQYGGPGGVRGEVVRLSLRTTWLRTADGVITIIGNTNLSAGPILNYSAGARLGKKL